MDAIKKIKERTVIRLLMLIIQILGRDVDGVYYHTLTSAMDEYFKSEQSGLKE